MRLRPFIAGAALYVAIVAAVLVAVGKRTGFQQIYCLDDTYIHLAIVKNLLLAGTFGVIPHHFAALSSSVIWPFALAAFSAIAGIHSVIPFVAD
ncbi:MAG: hypothetical protein JO061_06550, partial [Acidobacteriaceae bacterium]|nr:hypothetical protein [Acidobacteriaceae bacterium]